MVQKLTKVIRKLAKYTLLFHLGTQAAYFVNDLYCLVRPSRIRTEFQIAVGFPINGWSSEVEAKPDTVFQAVLALEQERALGELELDSIRVESPNYFKKNLIDQLAVIVTTGSGGYFIPGLEKIVVDEDMKPSIIHHEIKHHRTFRVLKKHLEFREKWEALSTDEKGDSLYLDFIEETCSRVRGLHRLISEKKKDPKTNEELGFVTSYARTNFFEDVAEVGEIAESGYNVKVEKWLLGNNPNDRIVAKFRLAEEYGIISRGFLDYIATYKKYVDSLESHGVINLGRTGLFMEASEDFLERYPNSVYVLSLRNARGTILMRKAGSEGVKIEEAIREFKSGIRVGKFRDFSDYLCAIERLKEIHDRYTGYEFSSKIYKDAIDEFWRRFKAHDLNLPSRGMNDLLEAYGEI